MSFDLSMSFDRNIMTTENKNEIMKYVYASIDGTLYDIATVVHFLYKDRYKVAKLKSKLWYVFDGLKWKPSELGPYYQLSTIVAAIYQDIIKEEIEKKEVFEQQMNKLEISNDENDGSTKELYFLENSLKNSEKIIHSFQKIIEKLKNVNTKETICKECLYLFYDPEFLSKLDTNPNLICFSNGILDLEQKELRAGRYDDFISISIKLAFTNPKTREEQKELGTMLDEFQQFRNKITSKRQNKLEYIV